VGSVNSDLNQVFTHNVHISQVSTTLGSNLARADEVALQLAVETNPAQRRSLNAMLDQSLVPAIDDGLLQLRALHAQDRLAERTPVERLVAGWSQFVALRPDPQRRSQDQAILAVRVRRGRRRAR
jgi:hypothetical protein